MYALIDSSPEPRMARSPRWRPSFSARLTPTSVRARHRIEQPAAVSVQCVEQRDDALQHRLEREMLATEGWRDVLGVGTVAALVCWLAVALLMGMHDPLTTRVAAAAGVVVALLLIPTISSFTRWNAVRSQVRRERRSWLG